MMRPMMNSPHRGTLALIALMLLLGGAIAIVAQGVG